MPAAARRVLLLAIVLLLVAPPARHRTAAAQTHDLPAPDAWAALERGDAAKAASLFRETLERDPYNPLLHFGAGYAAFALGRQDAAISALKKALAYDPRFAPAAVLLAQVAYASGDLDLAIQSMEKARALAPGEPYIARQLEQWRTEASVHGQLAERPGVRFRVLFEGGIHQALGDRVADVLESAYWRVGNTLNSYPGETLTVLLYTNRQFQDITRAPAWAGGRYDGPGGFSDLDGHQALWPTAQGGNEIGFRVQHSSLWPSGSAICGADEGRRNCDARSGIRSKHRENPLFLRETPRWQVTCSRAGRSHPCASKFKTAPWRTAGARCAPPAAMPPSSRAAARTRRSCSASRGPWCRSASPSR